MNKTPEEQIAFEVKKRLPIDAPGWVQKRYMQALIEAARSGRELGAVQGPQPAPGQQEEF